MSPAATDEKSKPKPACFVHGVIGTEHVDDEGTPNDSDVGRGRLRDSERSSADADPGGGGIMTFELPST